MSDTFRSRLFPLLPVLRDAFGTPFHIYDERGIRQTARALNAAFAAVPGFREFYAVKALPNPAILRILREEGFGFDCSSVPELTLSMRAGAVPGDIMFTSNNTTREEFAAALEVGAIVNLDDAALIDALPALPDLLCFRYNPGARRTGNAIIGSPLESKFGLAHDQLEAAYRTARDRGVRRFGLHTMLVSNERDYRSMGQTAFMLLEQVEALSGALDIRFAFVNVGGGLGIPYRPDEAPLDLAALAREVTALFAAFRMRHGHVPDLYMENGRYITGPHGALVTQVINRKESYRTYIGVDASMSALMRPGMYGAYHHAEIAGKAGADETVDVVGALCENNDKFAVQRELPRAAPGDLLVIHDTGAHGHAMGFNYNGRLRPKELLLRADGSVALIRRAETAEDYFATLEFEPKSYVPGG